MGLGGDTQGGAGPLAGRGLRRRIADGLRPAAAVPIGAKRSGFTTIHCAGFANVPDPVRFSAVPDILAAVACFPRRGLAWAIGYDLAPLAFAGATLECGRGLINTEPQRAKRVVST